MMWRPLKRPQKQLSKHIKAKELYDKTSKNHKAH